MVRIPAGKFLMGSTKAQVEQAIKDGINKSWAEKELPQHEVELPDYSIGKYPITNREYQVFVKRASYKSPKDWDGDQYPAEKGDHPVVYVSWEDANAFCKWLREKTNKTYRLPTEAEWEKAARGGDGRIWAWGNEFGEGNANTNETKIGDTTSVGQYSPQGDSPYGCVDMTGNVWEWTSTLNKEYPYHVDDGRENKEAFGIRILRGGSFYSDRRDARCPYRGGYRPNYFNQLGFRVAFSSTDKTES